MNTPRALHRHSDLRRLIDPGSIAVVGASMRPGAFGERVLRNLEGFRGRLYPINARHTRMGECDCYAALADLPEVPDCVIVAVPRESVEAIVEECGLLGVGGVIVFASGYSEIGTAERIAEQSRLASIASARQLRLAGPNTIGLVNCISGALMTFAAPLRAQTPPGPCVGLVSQSGALGFSLLQAMERGVAFSHVLTAGNSADLDVADYVAYLAEDEGCTAIACVLEGMSEPQRLIKAAGIARAAGKPLVVYKTATGGEGAAAAMSHTGSLAGSHDVYLSAFEQAGVIAVDSLESLVETTSFFAKMGRCTSSGVAALSISGGAAIIVADKAQIYDVPLPQPSAKTRNFLATRIPDFGSARNPCDMTAEAASNIEAFTACADAMLRDPNYGALVVPYVYAHEGLLPRIEALNELASRHAKPTCVVWMPQWLEGPGSQALEHAPHIALFRSADNCLATLAKWRHWSAQASHDAAPDKSATSHALRKQARQRLLASGGAWVGEHAAKALLAEYGIPMVAEQLTTSEDACVAVATRFTYPVALKVESHAIQHKTEAGVVRLALSDEAALRVAYRDIMDNALKVAPAEAIRGVLVQPMIDPGVEVIVGARIDPLFGPTVVVGLGGIMVELMRDSAVALAPLSEAQAMALLLKLKGAPLLHGFRGAAPVDLKYLARIVQRVGDFAADHWDVITELDINPLICAAGRIVGVDALIGLRQSAVKNSES